MNDDGKVYDSDEDDDESIVAPDLPSHWWDNETDVLLGMLPLPFENPSWHLICNIPLFLEGSIND